MPAVKAYPEDVDQKLMETFTRYGYDGATMELLAQATGLKKASLYHRFPGGKKDMAAHVLRITEAWFLKNVEAVIQEETMPVCLRLNQALLAIRSLFDDGSRNCTLRMLSACSETPYFRSAIASCFAILSRSFAKVAIENGMEEEAAQTKAREVIIAIQGSLVLSRALNDNSIFRTSIENIPQMLGCQ